MVEEARERYGIDLSIRAAVHTGVVVRADMGSPTAPDRDAIVGETPSVAARLQDLAAPGTLVISGATYELIRGWFLVAPLGPADLRGLDHPVEVYEVVDETPSTSRIEVQADLSPFVGRTAEVDALTTAWEDVQREGSATVAILGEAGVGKSRLADVIRRRVQADGATAYITHCSSYHSSTALYPIRRLIERVAGIDPDHDPHHALSRLWSSLERAGLADALPCLADLLGIPPQPWCPSPELDGARLREELLDTLVAWIEASTTGSPRLLVIDDVQWADATTLDLIGRVVAQKVPGLLLVLTARDGFAVPWPSARTIGLERLSLDELRELARRLPEGRALTPGHLDQVVERSDGVPLFLEELLRSSAVAAGEGDRPSSIPPALRDLLLARFAVPGADLRLAQAIATIGIEARRAVISAASGLRAADLDHQLAALVGAGVLLQGVDPDLFRFRHHLLADIAYDTQLLAARQQTHDRVAEVLLLDGTEDAAVVAHHLEMAGRHVEAVHALGSAADAAQSLGAFDEAGELLERSMALLERIPADERAEAELGIRLRRGMIVASRLGYAAPQAADDFRTASSLLASVKRDGYLDEVGGWGDGSGSAGEQAWSNTGLWATFMLQGQLDEADEVSAAMMRQLRPDGLMFEYLDASRGFVAAFRGDYQGAERDLVRSFAVLQRMTLPPSLPLPSDPAPIALAHLSLVESVRGRFDEAWAHSDQALALAAEMPFPRGPFSLCYVAGMRAALELQIGDPATALRFAATQASVAERHGYAFWSMVSAFLSAAIDVRDQVAGSDERATSLLAMLRAMGVLVWLPAWHQELGAVLLEQGDVEAARRHLDEAMEVADATGAHFATAEISRLQGEARLHDGDELDGLRLLREAVRIGVEQGATLYEVRARTSLCARTGDPADHEALLSVLEVRPLPDDAADARAARAVLAGRV